MVPATAGRPERSARLTAVRGILTVVITGTIAFTSLIASRDANGEPILPPGNGVFTGLTGGSYPAFQAQVGKHPAVNGVFITWGRSFGAAFGQASYNHARLMLHISTAQGYGAAEQITPRGIAQGAGDSWLVSLGAEIAHWNHPVYVRLLPEMNQANNAYCAYGADGSSRGASHSSASFRSAWRRSALILRGGPVAAIDMRLRALGLPPVGHAAVGATLPRLPVALLWVPQSEGTPNTQANSAAAYYPGDSYVDWIGTDFYSLYPNFRGLQNLYNSYPGKPFVFGEWALWNGDDAPWVDELFRFIGSHRRVRMALYNQGERSGGPFRLSRYPNSRREIRRLLGSPRFLAYAPEWQPTPHATARVSGDYQTSPSRQSQVSAPARSKGRVTGRTQT
jgi:hypothetical protein